MISIKNYKKLYQNELANRKLLIEQNSKLSKQRIDSDIENQKLREENAKMKICIECGKEFKPPIKHRGRNKLCSKKCWVSFMKKVSSFQNVPIASYKDGIKVKEYNSIKEASVDVNGLSTNIVKCLKGKTKSAYGYQWKYSSKCINGNILTTY